MGPRGLERRFDRFRRNGDPADLACVFDATAAEILEIARHLARDRAAAEDLLQRTFLTAIEAASTWDRSRRLMPWLLGILANHAKEASRSAARSPDPDRVAMRESEDPADVASRREEAGVAGQAIDELQDPARHILVMRYRQGLEPSEIALRLDMPPATVRSHLHRGLERVRRKVSVAAFAAAGLDGETRRLGEIRRVVVERASVAGAEIAAGAGVGVSIGGLVLGGILVSKKAFALAAVLLLLLGGAGFLIFWRDGRGDGSMPERRVAVLEPAPHAPTLAVPASAAEGRATIDPVALPAPTDPSKGSLEVRALAQDGEALPDEPFSFRRGVDPESPSRYRVARTGADGRGRLDGLEPGRAWVKLGHGPGMSVEIPAGGVARAEIRLTRGLDVEGVVVDPLGSPVVGAELWIDLGMTCLMGMPVTQTKAEGRFSLRDVDPYSSISARAVGYAPSSSRVLRAGEGKSETVRLVLGGPGTSVRGRVEDASRAPVAGALVVIGSTGYRPRGLPDGSQALDPLPFLLFTADDGTFAADGLAVGKTWVTVRVDGQGPYRALRDLVLEPVNDWTITLSAGVAVEGVVVDEAGSPVEGANVFVFYPWGNPGRWSSETDSQGRFRIADLPSDQAGPLSATHAEKGQGFAVVPVGGKPGPPDSNVRIVLHPRMRIRVRVVDEHGGAVAGRSVFVRMPRSKPIAAPGPTDADGRVAFEVVGQATYEVYVTDPEGEEGQPISRIGAVRPGADEVTLTVREKDRPTSRLLGRIVTPDGPLPDGARVQAWPFTGPNALYLSLDAASGRFESRLLQAGRYDLMLLAGESIPVPLARVRVEARRTVDLGEVRLDPPGSLVVTLHGAEEFVRARGAMRATGPRGYVWARCEPGGTARFAALPPGRYQIVLSPWASAATHKAGATASVVVESGREASLELTATPGHVRAIRVQGLAKDEVPGLTVEVHAEGEAAFLVDARFGDTFPEAGPGLTCAFAPGRYVAEAETADGRRASASFEVRGDGEAPVVVTGFR